MAQQVKLLLQKPEDLSSDPPTKAMHGGNPTIERVKTNMSKRFTVSQSSETVSRRFSERGK